MVDVYYVEMRRLTRDGTTAESVSRDRISGTNADREIFTFPVQLITCRTGNLTRLIHTLAICVTIHTYIRVVCNYQVSQKVSDISSVFTRYHTSADMCIIWRQSDYCCLPAAVVTVHTQTPNLFCCFVRLHRSGIPTKYLVIATLLLILHIYNDTINNIDKGFNLAVRFVCFVLLMLVYIPSVII